MSFLSLIIVFLLEQLRPLQYQRLIAAPLKALADFVESHINAGSYRHGVMAWMILVLPFALLALALHFLLYRVNPLLALLFNVLVLYLTMGFRQFSHHYSDIQQALGEGELERARSLLSEWRGSSCEKMGSADISRLSIELALAASHRHVFAVLLWFVILPGPCGAVLYRLSALLAEYWRERPAAGNSDFVRFSRQVFAIIDWFPVRATAAAFAVVGDFEDAVYCWRTQADQWTDSELGIVLASGAGALGVQLGMPVLEGDGLTDRVELGVGDPANVDFMQSAVGLVWRATVFWMLLLFLLGLASLVS
ncbi:MAG: CobD/CbiB family protein [Proteobacteria bacterium]|nr:CobD/CbiB family protein [Pseudomonadota bacterium]